MRKQILTPSLVRPEAAQPTADFPAPHTVYPSQALLSRCSWGHAEEPHQCHIPLDVSCRGGAYGHCSCLSLGKPATDCPCSPAQGRCTLKGLGAQQCFAGCREGLSPFRGGSPLSYPQRSNRGGWCICVPRGGMNGKGNSPADQTIQEDKQAAALPASTQPVPLHTTACGVPGSCARPSSRAWQLMNNS